MIIRDPTIAERYARALFAVAKRQGVVAQVKEDAEMFIPRSEIGMRLHTFLDAPQVPTEAKTALIRKAFEGRVHPLLYDLVQMLLARGRMEYTRSILRRFISLAERDQGIYPAQIVTAKPLDDEQKRALGESLERYTGARLKIKYIVDPTVIAGVRFSYGETFIDDTVRGKLYRMFHQMERALHEQGRT